MSVGYRVQVLGYREFRVRGFAVRSVAVATLFHQGTARDRYEVCVITTRSSSVTFRDVRRNRHSRSRGLLDESMRLNLRHATVLRTFEPRTQNQTLQPVPCNI